jgi:hypothetical protein
VHVTNAKLRLHARLYVCPYISHPRILIGEHEGKRPLGDLGIDWNIIIRWILEKLDMKVWTAFVWFKTGPDCDLSLTQKPNESFHKKGNIFDQRSEY